jgi:hypothetical protein
MRPYVRLAHRRAATAYLGEIASITAASRASFVACRTAPAAMLAVDRARARVRDTRDHRESCDIHAPPKARVGALSTASTRVGTQAVRRLARRDRRRSWRATSRDLARRVASIVTLHCRSIVCVHSMNSSSQISSAAQRSTSVRGSSTCNARDRVQRARSSAGTGSARRGSTSARRGSSECPASAEHSSDDLGATPARSGAARRRGEPTG